MPLIESDEGSGALYRAFHPSLPALPNEDLVGGIYSVDFELVSNVVLV